MLQVNAIESANMNKETLDAMKKGADVLKGIHGKLYVDGSRWHVTSVMLTIFPYPQ
jgi:hypothetical protein